MIVGIIVIILLAGVIYFWDDFPKWIEYFKKFWDDPSLPFQGRVKSKPKVSDDDREMIRKQMREQMNEAKRGFQEILDSHKSYGRVQYGQNLDDKLRKFQEELDNRKSSKTRSAKGELITEWERKFLWDGIKNRKRVPCINCETEDMFKGKTEGPYQHWHCPNCGQSVKLSFYSNTLTGFSCQNLGKLKKK